MGIPRGKRVVGRASLGVEAIRDRHGLEQGRLTRPVLANEKRDVRSKASERSPSDASAEIRRRYSSPWTSSHRIETEDMNSSPSSMTPPIVRAPNAVIVRARQDKALRHDEVTEASSHEAVRWLLVRPFRLGVLLRREHQVQDDAHERGGRHAGQSIVAQRDGNARCLHAHAQDDDNRSIMRLRFTSKSTPLDTSMRRPLEAMRPNSSRHTPPMTGLGMELMSAASLGHRPPTMSANRPRTRRSGWSRRA